MTTKKHRELTFPAEWEPQSAIQLTWPHEATDWKPYLKDIEKTFIELADKITRHEKLLVVTPHVDAVKKLLANRLGADGMANVIYSECDSNDTWARDHAAITLACPLRDDNKEGDKTLLDFKFNGWGEKFGWDKDNAITRKLYQQGLFSAKIEDHNDFVLEGGAVESDGKGTILTTTSCLLAPHRNQPMDMQQIERRLKDTLRVERVIWIDHGHLAGDDTDGHIDTIVRMAPNDTLLYVGCDNIEDEHYADLKAMERQLETLRTLNDAPYRLLRLPMPRPIYDNGERLPATYANFVILNGAVIVPTYQQPDIDAKALEVVGMAFENREIVGIDATTVIRQHGSLHCLTMQYPQGILRDGEQD